MRLGDGDEVLVDPPSPAAAGIRPGDTVSVGVGPGEVLVAGAAAASDMVPAHGDV